MILTRILLCFGTFLGCVVECYSLEERAEMFDIPETSLLTNCSWVREAILMRERHEEISSGCIVTASKESSEPEANCTWVREILLEGQSVIGKNLTVVSAEDACVIVLLETKELKTSEFPRCRYKHR